MHYRTRVQLAFVTSVLLTLLFVAALPWLLGSNEVYARVDPEPRSIRLDFSTPEPPPPPEEADPVRRLIDAGAEAEEVVRDTDLISSKDSQAQDNSDAEGDPARPDVDEVDDFDQLGTPPTPPPQPESPPVPPQPETDPTDPAPAQSEPAEAEPAPPEPAQAEESGVEPMAPADPSAIQLTQSEETAEADDPPEPEPIEEREKAQEPAEPQAPAEEAPPPERFEVAQAPSADPSEATRPSQPVPTQELRSTRGRDGGGALQSGFTSFEANKHELGEYMLTVRDAVEREWRAALQTRYRGASRTFAMIECSIRPDGSLEYARIVEPGDSLPYAILCREAIEKAAPFGPFPFDVPKIYRDENLQIRWKFSFM